GGWTMSETFFSVKINNQTYEVTDEKTIIQLLNKEKIAHPQVCYNPLVDPVQTCDTCIVEVDGELVRACYYTLRKKMNRQLQSKSVKSAQTEAIYNILENH